MSPGSWCHEIYGSWWSYFDRNVADSYYFRRGQLDIHSVVQSWRVVDIRFRDSLKWKTRMLFQAKYDVEIRWPISSTRSYFRSCYLPWRWNCDPECGCAFHNTGISLQEVCFSHGYFVQEIRMYLWQCFSYWPVVLDPSDDVDQLEDFYDSMFIDLGNGFGSHYHCNVILIQISVSSLTSLHYLWRSLGHLSYLVHKSGRKTSIISIPCKWIVGALILIVYSLSLKPYASYSIITWLTNIIPLMFLGLENKEFGLIIFSSTLAYCSSSKYLFLQYKLQLRMKYNPIYHMALKSCWPEHHQHNNDL